ncbi:hypothetical protein EGW08_013542, partial [Elysia chlorotica]
MAAPNSNLTRITLSFLLSMLKDNQFQGPEAPVNSKHHWSYKGPEGPTSWPLHYSHCGGKRQSPIDVPLAHCQFDRDLSPFLLDHFEAASGLTGDYVLNVTNNGHAASVRVNHDRMRVRGGGLPGSYKTAEFHFHWGGADDRGSEHSLDGRKFPLEYNVYISPPAPPVTVLFPGEHQLVDQFRLRYLLPRDLSRYWRYDGSLTTPYCFESVTWTLFEQPQKISTSQV